MSRTQLAACGLILLICQTGLTGDLTGNARALEADEPGYSAAELYNRANAYARAGKWGMAVLNYERARLLAPDDPDIEANLHHVRESARLPAEPPTAIDRLIGIADPTEIYWLGVIGVLLAGGSLGLGRRFPAHRWVRAAVVVVGVTLVGFAGINAVIFWGKLEDAVVLTGATPARATPVPMGDPLFTLPEAESVRMTAAHDEFILVETRAGRTGWVSRAAVAPVVPAGRP